MAYEFLKLEMNGGVGVLTLNRPETFNSWNQKMRDEVRDAMRDLVAQDSLRVLVITGTGRAFSAGEDVRGMQGLTDIGTRGFRRVARGIHNVFDEIEAIEIPVIAAINGVAAGGGMELALSCDFRLAADTAKMGFPENNVGLIPGSGGCSRLVKLVGLAVAKQLAGKAPLALGMAKIVLNSCLNVDPETGRNLERLGQSILKKTDDHLEGAKAFVEKRRPEFKGR